MQNVRGCPHHLVSGIITKLNAECLHKVKNKLELIIIHKYTHSKSYQFICYTVTHIVNNQDFQGIDGHLH